MRTIRSAMLRAWSCLFLLGALTACEETQTVAPADPVSLEVTPSGPLALSVGDTLRLHVSVQNASPPAVTFRSTAQEVASVTEGGLITALSQGDATILVTSVADPSKQVALVVRVAPRAPADSARAAISAILDPGTGQSVDRANARGRVLVRVDYTSGGASRIELLAGDAIFCTRELSATAAAAPLECVLDTAQFDSTTGAVAFPNGALPVSARLVGPGDGLLAAAPPVTLSLANPDRVIARLSAPREALDPEGQVWVDGPVAVAAIPVLYSRGTAVARAQFAYAVPGAEPITLVDAEAPFAVTLPESAAPAAGGLLGVVDPEFGVSVSTTLRGGGPGPQGVAGPVRYDNDPPTPGGVLGRDWIGAQTRFAALYDARAERDRGVGRVTARFFVGSPGASASEIVAQGREVRTGSELTEAPVGTYRFAALVCDALANCRAVEGFTFGVDLAPPVISATSLPDRAINPDQSLTVSVSDNLSGFAGDFLQAAVTLLDAAPGTGVCGPQVEDVDLAGKSIGGACIPDTVSALATPRGTAGYFTYVVAPLDRAGNVGPEVTRTLLMDRVSPTITSVSIPSQLTPGRDVTVRVEGEDNLDLFTASASLVYPSPQGGRIALPFAVPDTAGAPFDAELVTRHAASRTFPLISTLTYPEAGRISGARTVAADSIRVRVRDVARNAAEQGRALTAGVPSTTPFAALDSVDASLSAQNVCTARCLATDPTTTTLTARVIGPAGFRYPFEGGRIYFYLEEPDGTVILLGSTTSGSDVQTGTQRILSFSLPVRPAAGARGEYTLFAVGTNAAGNGLRLGSARLNLFTR